ncbi:TRAP transporter small permease [Halodurantibacterium flavum]|uniref:TRAP transporter small permease protein n=1 Tax=Halodurantibacterium flavum TaxID=1382802 RepID=A0ABW4S2D6_9RHOB
MFLRRLDMVYTALLVLASACGALMMLHVTADVAMRALFRISLPAVGEITAAYYMVAAAFLPWAWLANRDEHIRADLFSRLMPEGFKRGFEYVIDLLTLAYVGLICWQGYAGAMRRLASNEQREIPGGYLLVWPARWVVPVAAGAMMLALVIRMIRRARGELAPPPAPLPEH